MERINSGDVLNARLSACRLEIETYLEGLIEQGCRTEPSRLTGATRHALLGGGKRFRPFLVMECAALFGADGPKVLKVAGALEMVHCYSLVHDDLPAMDNDRLRRGVPTVWVAYDEWTAILAGDNLLTLAFDLLSRPEPGLDAGRQLRLVRELALASGGSGMIGGQVLDLTAEKLGEPASASVEHVRRIQRLKTGALIEYACRAGAIVAGASESEVDRIGQYGQALGLAFQISDDLLDAVGDEATVGKAVAKDAALGKATLVSLYGVEHTRQLLSDAVDAAHEALQPLAPRTEVLAAAADFMRDRRS